MDEEDGRPGARAVQTGLIDAPRGVVPCPCKIHPPLPRTILAISFLSQFQNVGAPGLASETWVNLLPPQDLIQK